LSRLEEYRCFEPIAIEMNHAITTDINHEHSCKLSSAHCCSNCCRLSCSTALGRSHTETALPWGVV